MPQSLEHATARILLAEDNLVQSRILTAWITGQLGCEVHAVYDGSEGNRLAGEGGWDLVITDIDMPGCDGLTLLRTSKERAPRTPALLLTAHDSMQYAVQALRDKADDFLRKPVGASDFVDAVRRLLQQGDANRAPAELGKMPGKGDVIDGRYVLRGRIGHGGHATVWLADDEKLEREVAIKLLHSVSVQHLEEAAAAFLREAKIAASFHHPNVVRVLDFGSHEGKLPYIVMELLRGSSLGDRFNAQERFDFEEIIDMVCATLEGLQAVHDAGMIHRDIKPENIFLAREGSAIVPKIIDFGISKAADPRSRDTPSRATQSGMLRGTPEYMSPEQARGLPDIDIRTDVYSMGVLLYECLVGRAPYESPNIGDLLVMVIGGGATPVREIVPGIGAVSDVIERAMSRDANERYSDAAQMHAALLAAVEEAEA